MNGLTSSLIDSAIQCWTCPIFDRLFQIVSLAATYIYDNFAKLCLMLLVALFALYVSNAWMKNMQDGMSDPFFKKSIQKVFLNSIVVVGLLGAGVTLPRTVSTLIFQPIASVTTVYTQSIIQLDTEQVDAKVPYTPQPMEEEGFFSPELRDKILLLMRTTITQFQSYIKLGVAVMDNAFTWNALMGVGNLLKHIMLFFIGFYLSWGFLKLFFRYCCRFADAIVAMAFFAFFFPLSLMTMAFTGAEHVPNWIKKLGSGVGINQIKNLVNSIVSLGSIVITYTIIMVVIAKFFSASDVSVNDLMHAITTGELYSADLNTENLESMTLMSCSILIYVLNYIYDQSKAITKMILDAFGVAEKTEYGEQVADAVMGLTKNAVNTVANVANIVLKKENKDDKEGK